MAEQIGKPNARIGIPAGIFWLISATVADLLSLIPFVGDIVGPLFWICFSIYLWKIGCGFLNARRLATEIISAVGEMIPVVQEFPLILVGTILVILMIVFEDKTGIKVMPTKGKFSIAQKGVDGNYLNKEKVRNLFQKGIGQDEGNENITNGAQSLKGRATPLNEGGVRQPQTWTGNTYQPEQGGNTTTGNNSGSGQNIRALTHEERNGLQSPNSKKNNTPYNGGIKGGSVANEPAIKPTLSGTMDSKKFEHAQAIKDMREMQRARNMDMPITEKDIKEFNAPGMDSRLTYAKKLDNAVNKYNEERDPMKKPTSTGSNTNEKTTSSKNTTTVINWPHSNLIQRLDTATNSSTSSTPRNSGTGTSASSTGESASSEVPAATTSGGGK